MGDSIFAIQMNRSGALLQAGMSYSTLNRFNLMSEDFVEKSISTFPTVIKSPVLSDNLWEEDTVPPPSYGRDWVEIGERTDAFIVLHCDGTTTEKEEDRTGTSDHPFLTVNEAFTFINTYLPLFCCVRNFRIVLHNEVGITFGRMSVVESNLYIVIEGMDGSSLVITTAGGGSSGDKFLASTNNVTFFNVKIEYNGTREPAISGCFCYGVVCAEMPKFILENCIIANSTLYRTTRSGCIVLNSTIYNAHLNNSVYIDCTIEVEEGDVYGTMIDCVISVNNSTGSPGFGVHAYRTTFNMDVHGKIYPGAWIYDSTINVITTFSTDTGVWGSAIFENGIFSLIGCTLNGQLRHTDEGRWSNRRWGLYCSSTRGVGDQHLLKDSTINITDDITPPPERPDLCIIFCPLAGDSIIIRDCEIAKTSQTTCPGAASECISL